MEIQSSAVPAQGRTLRKWYSWDVGSISASRTLGVFPCVMTMAYISSLLPWDPLEVTVLILTPTWNLSSLVSPKGKIRRYSQEFPGPGTWAYPPFYPHTIYVCLLVPNHSERF